MEDSEIRYSVEVLATAYRELAMLVDRAELEGLAGRGSEAHVLALRKACRDLTSFSEIVASLTEEAHQRQWKQGKVEVEYGSLLSDRLRTADRAQLGAILRTQERLLREVGIDDEAVAGLVEECRDSLDPGRDPRIGIRRPLSEIFADLAGQTCRLAEDAQLPTMVEPKPTGDEYLEKLQAWNAHEAEAARRRGHARKILRVSLKALAAAAAVGIGILATPIAGVAVGAVIQAVADVVLDETASGLSDLALPSRSYTDETGQAEHAKTTDRLGRSIGELEEGAGEQSQESAGEGEHRSEGSA